MKTNKEKFRKKIHNLMKIFTILILVFFVFKPGQVEAQEIIVSTTEELKRAIERAEDGNIIKIKDIKGLGDIKDFGGEKLLIDKNLTFDKKEVETDTYTSYGTKFREVFLHVYLKNIQLEIKEGKTLTLKNMKILGNRDQDVVVGDGNLIIQDGNVIKAKSGQNAINLPKGEVKIEGIEKKKDINDFENLKVSPDETITIWEGETGDFGRGYNKIEAGDAIDTSSGGNAIMAKEFVMTDSTNQAFNINGGNSKGGKGGVAITATNIELDLAHTHTYPHTNISIDIKGGDGKFPAGAIKGKEINLVAGNNRIRPGVGIAEDHGIKFDVNDENYTATVEVIDGGHLKFGKEDLDHRQNSKLVGFNTSFYYGPTILAKGNASVNMVGGEIYGAPSNYNSNSNQGYMPQAPVIHLGKGELRVVNTKEGSTDGDSKNLILITASGGHYFNAPKEVILTGGEVSLSGNVQVIGSTFANVKIGSIPSTGYSDNPLAAKVGCAGIRTTNNVTLNKGVHVIGGSIDNIAEDKHDEYQYGPGIIGNGKNIVIISEQATVQGYGAVAYSSEAPKQVEYMGVNEDPSNLSGGNGLENIGTVIINDGHVHGGDVNRTTVQNQRGKGTGGTGIKNCNTINISGESLVTGGSSTTTKRKKDKIDFNAPNNLAGPAIDNRGLESTKLDLSGDTKVFGGTSKEKGASAIVGVTDISIADKVMVYGGASGSAGGFFGGPSGNAGKGIEEAENVTITGGEVKAGNVPYQRLLTDYYIEYFDMGWKKVNLPKTLVDSNDKPGNQVTSVAIEARGKVLVDGVGEHMPVIQSFVTSGEYAPVVSLTGDHGALYVGQAKVQAGSPQANFVVGGKHHVDIFKNNNINTVTEVDGDGVTKGLRYNTKYSQALYRILEKDGSNYKDVDIESLRASEAYDDIFFKDKGIHLYESEINLDKKRGQEAVVRKTQGQEENTLEIDEEKTIGKMPNDNIILKVLEATLTYKSTDHTEGIVPETETAEIGTELLIKGQGTLKRAGYIFDGWKDESTGKTYQVGSKITLDSDKILVAVWKETPEIPEEETPDESSSGQGLGYILFAESEIEKIELHEAYIFGYPDQTVQPQGNVTRAEAAAMVARLEGMELENTTRASFNDIEEDAWYILYINAVVDRDMLLSDEDGNIRPNDPITRAEFARLLAPLGRKNDIRASFSDIEGHLYQDAINQEYGNKLLDGYPDGSFRPESEITRAEAATILNRKYDRVADVEALEGINHSRLVGFTDLSTSEWYYFEIVEAANTHKLTRRQGQDQYGRTYEKWQEVLESKIN